MIEDNGARSPIGKDGAVIYFFGDEQAGNEESESDRDKGMRYGFMRECQQEMVRQFQAERGAKFALHMGDSLDFIRPTMRARIEGALVHDPSARAQVDKQVRLLQDKYLKGLTAFEGRMLGVHKGHHTWQFSEGSTIEQRLAGALRARYLGWISATRLSFNCAANEVRVITICSTHGCGGGGSHASDANQINRLAQGTLADVYARGHSCKGLSYPASERGEIRRKGPHGIRKVVPWHINVPGMSKSYTNGWKSSYAEEAGYVPQPIGWAKLRITLVDRRQCAVDAGVYRDKKRPDERGGRTSRALHLEGTTTIFSNWGDVD